MVGANFRILLSLGASDINMHLPCHFLQCLCCCHTEGTAFYHPLFIREDPDNCCYIVREKRTRPKCGKAKSGCSSQPNRQAMEEQKLQQVPTAYSLNYFSNLPVVDTTTENDSEFPTARISSFLQEAPSSLSRGRGLIRHGGVGHTFQRNDFESNSNDLMATLFAVDVGQSTASWLASGAVSIKELAAVLQSYSQTHHNNNAPSLFPHQSSADDCVKYREDIISLFGEAISEGDEVPF